MILRRVLISVSDKTGVIELARAFEKKGIEILATGKTLSLLESSKIKARSVESVSGVPEILGGRLKTLSYTILGGVLYRRNVSEDLLEIEKQGILPIDCVVVNFYPFGSSEGKSRVERTELIDIGGPTMVRSAAKNAPSTLVLTRPSQYEEIIRTLSDSENAEIPDSYAIKTANEAWEDVSRYDEEISRGMNAFQGKPEIKAEKIPLRYGENPHQEAWLSLEGGSSPISWTKPLGSQALSYNNILDFSAAYELCRELKNLFPKHYSVVIIKHLGPCGVSVHPTSQKMALETAWAGDPVSSFGSVIALSSPLEEEAALFFKKKFIEGVLAPKLAESKAFSVLLQEKKNLKGCEVLHWEFDDRKESREIPGGRLFQSKDQEKTRETPTTVTKAPWKASEDLTTFGIVMAKALKSNAVSLCRETKEGALQLIGTGQGQPNRVSALEWLAIPRAKKVLETDATSMEGVLLTSDAFFPFRDVIDACAKAGIRSILQPGGSVRDDESIQACNEHGLSMAFSGRRHFKH